MSQLYVHVQSFQLLVHLVVLAPGRNRSLGFMCSTVPTASIRY